MTTNVSDAVLATFTRQVHDWTERVLKGSLDPVEVHLAVQALIDRGNKFNPAKFIGKGWKLDAQPSNLKTGLVNSDATKATTLFVSEKTMKGEDRLDLLAESGKVHLGAEDFLFFWNNKHLIPRDWEGKVVTFDATVLLDPHGYRYVLGLCQGGGDWGWHYYWLGFDFRSYCVSAVLAE